MSEVRNGGLLLVHYTDLAGFLRQVEVPYSSLESRFVAAFDGSSVIGFAGVEKSDMLLEADRETLVKVPWRDGVWRVIAKVYNADGSRSSVDPRYAAERALEYSRSLGFEPKFGAELEFFLLEDVDIDVMNPTVGLGYRVVNPEMPGYAEGLPAPVKKAYHYVEPVDKLASYRVELIRTLASLGYNISSSHHEVAVGQIEVSIGPGNTVKLGDGIATLKWASRVVASRMGLHATFMPKPIYGDNGSGMHIHASLWSVDGKTNLFASDEEGVSETARHFIAGVLEHARSLAAILSPTTNSYRRLVPGYEAPVYVAWGFYNRTAMIRIPTTKGVKTATRIEVRSPDPSSNPYLALSALLMAGLDGVKKKLEPPEPYEGSLYTLTLKEAREKGIGVLPRSLDEALDELETDNEYLRPAFTKDLLETYIEVKRAEAEEVRLYPHPVEIYKYLTL